MSEFYLRNKNAGFLGNSPVWYGKNGQGYTAYLLGAERFSKEKAEKMVAEDPEKWEMYDCDHIDERLHLIFDYQDKQRLGTDEPCQFFKYADNPQKQALGNSIFINGFLFNEYQIADIIGSVEAVKGELESVTESRDNLNKFVENDKTTIEKLKADNLELVNTLEEAVRYTYGHNQSADPRLNWLKIIEEYKARK